MAAVNLNTVRKIIETDYKMNFVQEGQYLLYLIMFHLMILLQTGIFNV